LHFLDGDSSSVDDDPVVVESCWLSAIDVVNSLNSSSVGDELVSLVLGSL